ncbi:MAG: glutathione transferase GstA [Hyphomonadaceae bacterium]|nr:glutathione transferase GstA [Hyphomonadaceae bacterium]
MNLYYVPGACSLGPHIIIREAGLDAKLDKVTFGAQRTTESGKDFYTINPQGAVPALELDNGEVLTEAQVLLQYLAAQNPSANLAITEGPQRWRFLETLNFIATELHKGTGPLFKPNPDEVKEAAKANLVNRYKLLEQKLGDKDYLLGQFTVADAYAYVVLNWARLFGVPLSAKLNTYFERIRARPAVQQTLKEEGLPTS